MTIEFICNRNEFFINVKRLVRKDSATLVFLRLMVSLKTMPRKCIIVAHDVDNVSEHIRTLVACIDGEADRETLQSTLGIKHRTYFRNTYLKPSIDKGYLEFALPNEKQSKLQKYRLTAKGLALKEN